MDKCTLDPQRDCLGLQKAEMLEKQLDEWRSRSRETHLEMYRRIASLEQAGASRDAQYQAIMDKLTEMSKRLDDALATVAAIKEKPARRWESIVDKSIWAVLAAVIAFVLGRAGL